LASLQRNIIESKDLSTGLSGLKSNLTRFVRPPAIDRQQLSP